VWAIMHPCGLAPGGKVLMLDRSLEDVLPYLFFLLRVSEPAPLLPQGERTETRQMLADIYNWFTEGLTRKTCKRPRPCLTP
jgi:hypothetical protein